MRIYWYWPHPHRCASRLALAMLRPDDSLTVQALASLRGERFAEVDEYEVIRTLPDPTATAPGHVSRLTRKPAIALARARARRRLLRRGFDVAHLEMLAYQSDWLDVTSLGRRTPLVSSVHDVRPHRSQLPPGIETRMLRRLYRGAGELIVYHSTLATELVTDFQVPRDRVHVVPVPLDATDRRDSGIRGSDPLILFFGSLRENKGIRVLLEALTQHRSELANTRVVIAGAGDPELESLVEHTCAPLPHVECEVGFVPAARKHQLFSMASVVVLPYTSFHSQSGVLADAYAYRVPSVVTDVGALGPTVRDDATGCVVQPGSAEALVSAITELVERPDPFLPDRLESAARRHDYGVVGPMLREIYDVAVARSG